MRFRFFDLCFVRWATCIDAVDVGVTSDEQLVSDNSELYVDILDANLMGVCAERMCAWVDVCFDLVQWWPADWEALASHGLQTRRNTSTQIKGGFVWR